MSAGLYSFLVSGLKEGPSLAQQKYYEERSIFNKDVIVTGSHTVCQTSLFLDDPTSFGNVVIMKNPNDKKAKIPNLFVDGTIYGKKNFILAKDATISGTLTVNKDAIMNKKLILARCGDVAQRVDRADALPSSDERLKENITPIQNALDKVKELNGVEFDFKNSDDYGYLKQHQIGLIAQEVEKVIPEIVSENKNGYLGVSYQHLTALLIEAVKEQQKQIEELKTEINLLKGENK